MKRILEQLYNGDIFPAEQSNIELEGHKQKRHEQYKHYEDFVEQLKKFSPPLEQRFIAIMDEQLDALPFDMAESFIYGFRLGARIMMEVLDDE